MTQFGNLRYEWLHETPIPNGGDVVIMPGAGGGRDIISGQGILWLTWGVISSHAFNFIIEGAFLDTWAVVDNLVTQACLGGAYYTPYQLAAPMTGSRINVTRPMLRIRVVDTAAVLHTYTRVYVKGWWG